MKTTLALLAVFACLFVCSCRTAGPQISIRDSHHCTATVSGDTHAAQGKTVSGEVSPDVAASVTAQARDNVLAEGNATNTGGSGDQKGDSPATTDDEEPPADSAIDDDPVRATRESPSTTDDGQPTTDLPTTD